MAQPEQPPAPVAFIYERRDQSIHLEQRGLQDSEYRVLLTAMWLQMEVDERTKFVEQLITYLAGEADPPAVAIGMAAIVHRVRNHDEPGTNGLSPN